MNKEMSLQERHNYCIVWEKSGKSRLAFCRANGISPSTFQGWYHQYRTQRTSEMLFSPMVAEPPVPVMQENPAVQCEIRFPNETQRCRCRKVHWFLLFRGFVMQLQLYGKKIGVYRRAIDFRRSIVSTLTKPISYIVAPCDFFNWLITLLFPP